MRKLLVLFGLAGAAAAVAKKFSQPKPVWHTPETGGSGTRASEGADGPADDAADDAAGSAPDEALADAAEAPHGVTTPDAPLEKVDLKDD